MKLIEMRPEQLKRAVAEKWPVLIPVGAIEYHGDHMPIGTDTLIAEGICQRIAERAEVVLAPTLTLTPTMNWAGSILEGDVDFPSEALEVYARAYLVKLTEMGLTQLYAMVGHGGEAGLPAIVLKKISRELTGMLATQAMGAGWSILPASRWPAKDLFAVLQVIIYEGQLDYEALGRLEPMPVGHGGRGETQLVMALTEGLVRMDALAEAGEPLPFWLEDVGQADREDGAFWVKASVDSWVDFFRRQREGNGR